MIHLLDKLDSVQLSWLIVILAITAGITITSVAHSVSQIFQRKAPVAQRTEPLATDQEGGSSSLPGRAKEEM